MCPWDREIQEPDIHNYLWMISLINAGCPANQLPEIRYSDWIVIGALREECDRIAEERARKKDMGKA